MFAPQCPLVGANKKKSGDSMFARIHRLAVAAAAFVCVLGGASAPASAQSWPSRTVTIITPFAAGSVTDATARIIGQVLQDTFGASVVVENKAERAG